VKARLRSALRPLVRPLTQLRSFFSREVREHVDRRADTVEEVVRATQARMTELESRVSSDTQTSAEFAATFRRSTDRLRGELQAMWGWATAGADPLLADLLARSAAGDTQADIELGKLVHDLLPGAADRVVGAFEGVRLPIGPGTADFLNWSSGHNGPAAQAGVWFNPAVTVFHHDGTVRPGDVNERIVEIPWVMGLATTLEPDSLVLDFGATESTVSLSLASLGLDVIAADLRPYPLAHPRLRSITGPIEQWDGPERPLDAVFCVSALEHVGLGAYDETPTVSDLAHPDLDRRIVERFARWLKPGGEIAFTAPYGRWEVNELQRVYDAEHLGALFAGWRVTGRVICIQTAHDRWERVNGEPAAATWDDGTRGVVLLRATPDT
jgi:SAM-dependent methyltransferase